MRRTPLRRVSPNKVKKPKAHDAGWWQKVCDSKMQDINRSLNKKCEISNGPCQTGHHFITKAQSSWLRYKFENLIPISFARHFDHHQKSDPSVVARVVQLRGEEWLEWIEQHRRLSQSTGISYYKAIYSWLSEIENHIEAGRLEEAKRLMKSYDTEDKRFIKFRDQMA